MVKFAYKLRQRIIGITDQTCQNITGKITKIKVRKILM